MKFFCRNKRFYKGNLHTHTRLSDGRKTPDEAVALYKAHGYDFIAITDHRKRFPGCETSDFIVLSGGEYHYQPGLTAYHILGIDLKDDVITDDSTEPQEIIDRVIAAGGFPILAHPSWSLMTPDEALALHGYEAVEIYNGISAAYANRGVSDQFIDICATRDRITGIIADDDAHFYDYDFCRGFIMVQPEAFTTEAIMKAIRERKYYASTGPKMFQLERDDASVIKVDCEEVEEIYFMSNTWFTSTRTVRKPEGGTLTHAEYTPAARDKWVRVEGKAKDGTRFWSNIIEL
ncbi:MAG: hypothetical protein GX929_05625 [Clostridiales bacterium]|nr:hypothetical protein [Clostridiales bacterium]